MEQQVYLGKGFLGRISFHGVNLPEADKHYTLLEGPQLWCGKLTPEVEVYQGI